MAGKKDKKKKGLGALKTATKTEKKLSAKLKKELAQKGEEDVESLIAKFVEEDRKKSTKTVIETAIDRPSKRSNFSLVSHPTKDLLLMFGGEWSTGKATYVYNDLFSYDIKKRKWSRLECPGGPPPRSSHQAACIAGDGGQMWIFGGEFASPSESQFYHYRDLWVFHLKDRRWEKVETKGGPSGRSGHRMVVHQLHDQPPKLAIFGGFHDSLRGDCRYYNDFHLFDLSERIWRKVDVTGVPPAPRSGHLMAALGDGRIFVHGGFSKVSVKSASKKKGAGDEELGFVHTDSFYLAPDKRDATGTKFKWIQTKSGGSVPSKRCSSSLAAWTESGKNVAFVFGGVFDDDDENRALRDDSDSEDEDDSEGIFYDELYSLDLAKPSWKLVELTGPREGKKKRRRKGGDGAGEGDDCGEEDAADDEEEKEEEAKEQMRTLEDGVFTITIGPSQPQSVEPQSSAQQGVAGAAVPKTGPSPRMSPGLTVKNGVLYAFGGIYEKANGATLTYSDFYSLDLRKMDEWECLLEPEPTCEEEMDVDSSGEDEEDESSEDMSEDECDDDEEANGAVAMQVE